MPAKYFGQTLLLDINLCIPSPAKNIARNMMIFWMTALGRTKLSECKTTLSRLGCSDNLICGVKTISIAKMKPGLSRGNKINSARAL